MRYDKTVNFLFPAKRQYNPDTGDYEDESVDMLPVPASVMDTGLENCQIIYGRIPERSLTFHIQGRVLRDVRLLEYEGRRYQVDRRRTLQNRETFVVSEVH